jgi:hypothetical protein
MSLKQSMWTTTFWLVLLAIAAADLARAEPQANPTTTAPPSSSSSPSQGCGFQGDTNTYGLGVRVGVYAQWVGSALAYLYVREEARSMAGLNLVFTLSNFAGATPLTKLPPKFNWSYPTFAGLLYITATSVSNGTLAIECWIVLSLCIGGIFSGQGTVTNKEKEKYFAGYKASAVSRAMQYLVLAAIVYYTIWFLYVGMDSMTAPCPQYAFFFAKVVRCSLHSQRLNLLTFSQDMYRWFRTFLKVLFTMAGFFFTLSIFLFCIARRTFSPTRNGALAFFNPHESSRDDDGPQYTNISISLALAFFIV